MPKDSRAVTRTGDLLHLPGFAVVTYVAIMLSDRFVSRSTATRLLTTLTVVFFSACIELLQTKLGRTASLGDLFANSVGASAAFVFYWTRDKPFNAKWTIRSAMFLGVLYAGSGLVLAVWDVYVQRRHPATLASFYSNAELDRWYFESVDVAIVSDDAKDGDTPTNSLAATFYPGRFPALQLQQMTEDWTGYDKLMFKVSCPTEPPQETLTVQLHISDRVRIRRKIASFVKVFEIAPGQSKTISLPIKEIAKGTNGRTLDITQMRLLEFQAMNLSQKAKLQVADIHLVEKPSNSPKIED